MWVHLDFSGTSIWFWLGLAVALHWIAVTLTLLAVVAFGLCCRGILRGLVLSLAAMALVLVGVGLATVMTA